MEVPGYFDIWRDQGFNACTKLTVFHAHKSYLQIAANHVFSHLTTKEQHTQLALRKTTENTHGKEQHTQLALREATVPTHGNIYLFMLLYLYTYIRNVM